MVGTRASRQFYVCEGKLTKTLTKLYDGLVDILRTFPKLTCPGEALAKSIEQKKL